MVGTSAQTDKGDIQVVTSGAGFMGSHLPEAPIARGDRAACLERPAAPRCWMAKRWIGGSGWPRWVASHGMLAATATLASVLACGNGITEIQDLSDVAGTWVATRAEFTVIADPSQNADLIALGGSFVMVIEAAGSFRFETRFPGEDMLQTAQGTVHLSGSTLVFEFDPATGEGGTLSFSATLAAGRLRLVGEVTLERGDFGFTADEFGIPTRLEMDLRRR